MVDIAPGTALGPYVIVGRLGRGGMATVYRAHHAALDRDVAIKVVWPSLAEAPGFLERFQREARAVSRLRHPNILNVYDFGRQDGVTYMVTELLPGGSLADRLGRPLPLRDAVDVARGVGAALDHAHTQGIVHRDVKPSNILFTADGTPVLADFGIARMTAESEQLTVQGTLVGTPEYMSPEQALGNQVGPASDVYSLGVVLYQMVAGAPPFQAPTTLATLRAQVEDPMPSTRLVNRALPPAVDRVLERALSKDPRERYLNATALANAFAQAVQGAPVAVGAGPADATLVGGMTGTQVNVGYVDPTGVMPVQRRSRLLPALLTLLAVSIAAGLLAFLFRAIWSDPGRATPTPTRIIEGAVPGAASPTPIAITTLAPIVLPTAAPSPTPIALATPSPAPTPPAVAASPEPTVQVAGPSPAATAPPSPVVVVLPTTPPTAPPTPPPAPTALPAKPTLPPAKPTQPGSQPPPPPGGGQPPVAGVQITSPANGATVPPRPTISGRVNGPVPPNQHLWMFFQPRGPNENAWPYVGEIDTDDEGRWQVRDAELGGPPGTVHAIVVGLVDEATHQQLQRRVASGTNEPLSSLPAGFREAARITVTKGR